MNMLTRDGKTQLDHEPLDCSRRGTETPDAAETRMVHAAMAAVDSARQGCRALQCVRARRACAEGWVRARRACAEG